MIDMIDRFERNMKNIQEPKRKNFDTTAKFGCRVNRVLTEIVFL